MLQEESIDSNSVQIHPLQGGQDPLSRLRRVGSFLFARDKDVDFLSLLPRTAPQAHSPHCYPRCTQE